MLKNLVPHFKVVVPLDQPGVEQSADEIKEIVIRALVSKANIRDEAKVEEVVQSLLSREAKGSTGLGRNIAIPHARTECIEKPVIVLGVCQEGIDWEAQDGKHVILFFLILVPLEQSDLYLRILTRLTSLVRQEGFVAAVKKCESEDTALDTIHDFELKLKLEAGRAAISGANREKPSTKQL